ncbi:MAG TPA: helix-turn-helix domain-containing protein, partial [Mycobacterium sp.]|nr:helix-turn-helix domain-containing protein [Mycobacterium sp.]
MANLVATESNNRVCLLDEDPDLGSGLTAEDRDRARRFAVAEVVELQRGWHSLPDLGTSQLLGILVLDGLMMQTVGLAERQSGAWVGPGDVLRPWDEFAHPVPHEVRWRVISPVRVAMLDQHVAFVCARWPVLINEVVRRALGRAHLLAQVQAIRCLEHVENRLLVLMWDLADRFGRVTLQGTIVPLKLTHDDLALLAGATRPSVSMGLTRLARQGIVSRRPDRTWLLCGQPPQALDDYRRRKRSQRPRALGLT